MSIKSNIEIIENSLPKGVSLVCVSKFKPVDQLQEAYNAGCRLFGESRVQELTSKAEELPKDIEWHFIGNLQTNKIKQLLPYVSLIHSVDSLRLLEEINKQAVKNDIKVDVLLEVHIAKEETKHGFSIEDVTCYLESLEWQKFTHVNIVGLMGMASFTDDTDVVEREFASISTLFNSMLASCCPQFKHLSIGMSNDYLIAIKNGATLVRVGSSIFGER